MRKFIYLSAISFLYNCSIENKTAKVNNSTENEKLLEIVIRNKDNPAKIINLASRQNINASSYNQNNNHSIESEFNLLYELLKNDLEQIQKSPLWDINHIYTNFGNETIATLLLKKIIEKERAVHGNSYYLLESGLKISTSHRLGYQSLIVSKYHEELNRLIKKLEKVLFCFPNLKISNNDNKTFWDIYKETKYMSNDLCELVSYYTFIHELIDDQINCIAQNNSILDKDTLFIIFEYIGYFELIGMLKCKTKNEIDLKYRGVFNKNKTKILRYKNDSPFEKSLQEQKKIKIFYFCVCLVFILSMILLVYYIE